MQTLKQYAYPLDVEEATALLAAGRDQARAVAGGTSLIFHRGRGFHTLVDLSRLGLDYLRPGDDALVLGAGLRLQQVAQAKQLATPGLEALAEAARRAGPRAVRNAVTVGGNLVGLKRWADLPIALCALGARAHLAGPEGAGRELAVTELVSSPPWKQLAPGELLTQLDVPLPPARSGAAFVKFSRTFSELALVSAAAAVTLDEAGRCQSATLFVGALRHLPTDVSALARELVLGQESLDEGRHKQLAEGLASSAEPAKDMRVSTAYHAEVAGVVAADALAEALTRAHSSMEGSHD